MNLKVPYLPDAAIEASASALLAAYARREGSQIRPPVPVESILQDHLYQRIEAAGKPRPAR